VPKPTVIPTPKLLFKRKEACVLLSISLRKLDDLLASGELPVRRIHGGVFITYEALRDFVSRDHLSKTQSA
jgi:hypothetical protein